MAPRQFLSSLNVLVAFEAAARRGSFKDASEELNVTASAVSQQIKTLEDQLDVTLFERHPRGLILTDAGKKYATEIRPHLAALGEATERLRKSTRRRQLRVTVMPPLASRIVLPGMARFRSLHGDLDLLVDTSLRYFDLQLREFDLAIRSGVPPWLGCIYEPLMSFYAVPVCSPEIAARFALDASPTSLIRAPLVHSLARPDSWRLYFTHLGLGAPRPPDEFFVDHYPAAIDAAGSVGVALALWPLEKELVDSGRLVTVGTVVGPLPEALYAVRLDEKRSDPDVEAFLTWLREELARLT